MSTPNVRSTDDETISGVAAISGSDVWAVGQDDDPGTVIDGLIENWNGSPGRSPLTSTSAAPADRRS